MQAARLHEYTTDLEDALSIEDIPPPKIDKSKDIIIKIKGSGWCGTDNHIIQGHYEEAMDIPLPLTLGHENAGEVTETGEDVSLVEPGDDVICYPTTSCGTCRACRLGNDMHCERFEFHGLTINGGFAKYMRTPERSVIPLESADPTTIAPHADAGITAYTAVKKAIKNLVPGNVVLVVGIGGLGHIGVQILAEMSSATIIAVDKREDALELAKNTGVDHTINPSKRTISSEISDITDGGGVKQILDFVGADETISYALEMLQPGGEHHIVGTQGQIKIPTQAIVGADISYRGTLVGHYTDLQELLALIDTGSIELRTEKYGIDNINKLPTKLEEGEINGRAVITP